MCSAPLAGEVPALPPRFQAPAGLRWGTIESHGAHLRWASLPSTGEMRAACVLVGGFAEFAEKYFETMSDLAAAGLAVWFLDWRGQGGSERAADHPARASARDFDRDADDLMGFATKVLPPTKPRILVAHSMGGSIGLLALSRTAALFDVAVLSAPMLAVQTTPFPPRIAYALTTLALRCGMRDRFAPGHGPWRSDPAVAANSLTTHDPDRACVAQAWFETRPDLRIDGPTYGWVNAAMALTGRLAAPELLRSIPTPMLIGCPGNDAFVVPNATQRAADILPRATLMNFPASRHELFMEADDIRADWMTAIRTFLTPWLSPRETKAS